MKLSFPIMTSIGQPIIQANIVTHPHPIIDQFPPKAAMARPSEDHIAFINGTTSNNSVASSSNPNSYVGIGWEIESPNSHVVESHDPSVIKECSVAGSEGSITFDDSSQYQTAVESQDEGTAHGENLATTTTDLAPRSSTSSNAHHSVIPQGVFNLTEAALMAHHCSLNVNMSLDEIRGLTRPDELLQAAREMGFELPRECFESESRNLCDWVEAERYIRAHDRRT